MKLNKLIPLTFAAVLGLAACGGGGGSSSQGSSSQGSSQQSSSQGGGGTTTKILVWAAAEEQQVVDAVLASYNAGHQDKIEIEYFPISEADVGPTLSKNPTAENAPDLFLIADDQLYALAKEGIPLNITTTAYATSIKERDIAAGVTAASVGTKLYGFPATSDNGFFLWYDSSKLTANDVSSMENLFAAAKQQNKKVLLDIGNSWYIPMLFFGKDVCGETSLVFKENEDGDVVYDITWDTDVAAAQAKYMAELLEANADYVVEAGDDALVSGFEDGELIAGVRGTWNEKALTEILGEKLAATKLPTLNGKTLGTFTGSKIYCVNSAKSDEGAPARMSAAAKLADALTNQDGQLVRFQKRASGTTNKALMDLPAYKDNASKGLKALGEQCAVAAAVQSTSAEGRYWATGTNIANAVKDNDIGEFATWKEFLHYQCEVLRNPK
jgi:arabinogalactan oligomer/maltooligosaccharide transport system substrate-binding protein